MKTNLQLRVYLLQLFSKPRHYSGEHSKEIKSGINIALMVEKKYSKVLITLMIS